MNDIDKKAAEFIRKLLVEETDDPYNPKPENCRPTCE